MHMLRIADSRRVLTAACLSFSVLLPVAARAQAQTTITAAEKSVAIKNIEATLGRSYVSPEKAEAMISLLERKLAAHTYDEIADGPAFAAQLTKDLEAASRDYHVYVSYAPDAHPIDPPLITPQVLPPPPAVLSQIEKTFVNDGFIKAEILPGNIGYLRVDVLLPRELMEKVAPAAFHFVAGTNALILDFRKNGGALGPSSMSTFAGYFFARRTQFDTIFWRNAPPSPGFSAAKVAGPRYTGRPIYILTSGHTASGAEGFAYIMKAFKRARVIGMPTMGAANPGAGAGVSPHFELFVPIGRVENIVTKSNWDYTGVMPDVRVNAIDALQTAQEIELTRQIASTHESSTEAKLRADLDDVRAQTKVQGVASFRLEGYRQAGHVAVAGSFNYNSEKDTPMHRSGAGWYATAALPPGRYTYHFVVDGIRVDEAERVIYVK